MPSKYAEIRDTEIFRVDPREPFYHGTKEEPFESLTPGSSVTPDWSVARNYADRGAWFGRMEGPDDRPGRVASYAVDLPEGAPFVGITPEFADEVKRIAGHLSKAELDRLENREDWTERDIRREQERRDAFATWHEEAEEQIKERGYPAYFTPFYLIGQDEGNPYTGRDSGLVILDPNVAILTADDASEPPPFVRGRVHLYAPGESTPWGRKNNYRGFVWERVLDGIPVKLEKAGTVGNSDWILSSDHPRIRALIAEHGNVFRSERDAFSSMGDDMPKSRPTPRIDVPITKIDERHPGWIYSKERGIFVKPTTTYDPDNDPDLTLMEQPPSPLTGKDKKMEQLRREFEGISIDSERIKPIENAPGQYRSLQTIRDRGRDVNRGRGRLT